MSVKLLVNNPYTPNVGAVAVDIEVFEATTILDLKRQLQVVYPGSPEPGSQRLIFFGKLLADESLVEEIFPKSNEPQHIHLLIPVVYQPPVPPVVVQNPIEPVVVEEVVMPDYAVAEQQRQMFQQQWYRQQMGNHQDFANIAAESLGAIRGLSSAAFSLSMDTEDIPEHNVDEPSETYEDQINELKYHYGQLMKAIELSQRLQQANSMMFMNCYQPAQEDQPSLPHVDVNPPVENPPPAQALYGRVIVVNVRLLIKLAFMIYFLGDDVESTRFYILIGVAALIYLYECGFLVPLLGTRESQYERIRRLGLLDFSRIARVDSVPGTVFTESYIVAKTFVLSLIPSWSVDPQQIEIPADVNEEM